MGWWVIVVLLGLWLLVLALADLGAAGHAPLVAALVLTVLLRATGHRGR